MIPLVIAFQNWCTLESLENLLKYYLFLTQGKLNLNLW